MVNIQCVTLKSKKKKKCDSAEYVFGLNKIRTIVLVGNIMI